MESRAAIDDEYGDRLAVGEVIQAPFEAVHVAQVDLHGVRWHVAHERELAAAVQVLVLDA